MFYAISIVNCENINKFRDKVIIFLCYLIHSSDYFA